MDGQRVGERMTFEWKRGVYIIIPSGRGCVVVECVADFRKTTCEGWDDPTLDTVGDLNRHIDKLEEM